MSHHQQCLIYNALHVAMVLDIAISFTIKTWREHYSSIHVGVPYIPMFTGIPPPVITLHPMDTVIQLFTNFTNHTLTCEADEASSYNWERQNDVIPSDSTGVNTNTLTLINLQPEDAGNYRCVVTNVRGSNKSNYATVNVTSK